MREDSVPGIGPAELQLEKFFAKYSPEIAASGKSIVEKMCVRLPGATQLVYDNYNALVIGFGPSERASEAIFSIALYPRWINLFFLRGATLKDTAGVLRGNGKIVRSLKLNHAAELDDPAIHQLMEQALNQAPARIDPKARGRLIIKSVSQKQRPRLPR